jgi:hypothetical protein
VFKYHSDPTLNTVDFILTIFHASTAPRARQKSKDLPNAGTHNTVGERVVSLVLCTSSTTTWTRSSSQIVLSKPQRITRYDRIVATSSSHGDTPCGIIIAQQHPSRGIINARHHQGAAFSIARYSSSRGILHRAASSSRGILHRAASSSRGILHRVASSSCGIIRRMAFSPRGILHRAASSSCGIIHRTALSSRGILHRAASSSCSIIHRTASSIARHRHRTVTCETCVAHKDNAEALCKSSNACRTECLPKEGHLQ